MTNGLTSCPQDSGVEMVSVLGLFPEQVSVGGVGWGRQGCREGQARGAQSLAPALRGGAGWVSVGLFVSPRGWGEVQAPRPLSGNKSLRTVLGVPRSWGEDTPGYVGPPAAAQTPPPSPHRPQGSESSGMGLG